MVEGQILCSGSHQRSASVSENRSPHNLSLALMRSEKSWSVSSSLSASNRLNASRSILFTSMKWLPLRSMSAHVDCSKLFNLETMFRITAFSRHFGHQGPSKSILPNIQTGFPDAAFGCSRGVLDESGGAEKCLGFLDTETKGCHNTRVARWS